MSKKDSKQLKERKRLGKAFTTAPKCIKNIETGAVYRFDVNKAKRFTSGEPEKYVYVSKKEWKSYKKGLI